MTFPLDNFLDKAAALGRSVDFQHDIKNYVTNLERNGLPVIFSLPHLCLLAGVNIRYITELCDGGRESHYKRFKLKKKRGGYRVIHVPSDELKYLQRWILFNILEKIPSHSCCRGFDKTKSIKKNAEPHLGKEGILKIDLLRFYDSVNEKRLFGIFKGMGYHSNLSVSIAKICTFVPDNIFLHSFKKSEHELKTRIVVGEEGILPQGAPSSPKLSNLVARRLDVRIAHFACKNNLSYSRYADDITLSGAMETLTKAKKVVYKIIQDENLFVNFSKTKLLKRGSPFFVTGLSVNNEIVTVPKRRKIEIEHHLFNCKKHGVMNHLQHSRIRNRNFKDWLLGNIAFVFSVEQEAGKKYFELFNKIEWPI